jgi:hypothetical protein
MKPSSRRQEGRLAILPRLAWSSRPSASSAPVALRKSTCSQRRAFSNYPPIAVVVDRSGVRVADHWRRIVGKHIGHGRQVANVSRLGKPPSRLNAMPTAQRAAISVQEPSYLNDSLTFARYASTFPFASSCRSSSTISATRRSRRDLEACSTALAAAFSQDSLLVPISSPRRRKPSRSAVWCDAGNH